jgi:hypothetical protein
MAVSGQRHAPAALLPPGKGPPVPIIQEAGWGPEPVWTQRIEEKSFAPRQGSNPDRPVVQPVVRHYTAWANPAPEVIQDLQEIKYKVEGGGVSKVLNRNLITNRHGECKSSICSSRN